MCPKIKTYFHEHILKYADDEKDFTVACDLQGKQKLYHGIQTLITARSLEDSILNYICDLILDVVTFSIPRSTDFKYSSHCSSLALDCSHAKYTV